jgi:hypothetical protein
MGASESVCTQLRLVNELLAKCVEVHAAFVRETNQGHKAAADRLWARWSALRMEVATANKAS